MFCKNKSIFKVFLLLHIHEQIEFILP